MHSLNVVSKGRSALSKAGPATARHPRFDRGTRPAILAGVLALAIWIGSEPGTAGETGVPTVVSPTVADTKDAKPWQRIVLVGASVSAGFTESEPLGGKLTPMFRLHRYFDAALPSPHDPIQNQASPFFFMQPEVQGKAQIEAAIQARATLVVGIDFLFWYVYGKSESEDARLAKLETGLELLDSLHRPLVIGDIPDASVATNSLLRVEQVPSHEVMKQANQRITAWAADRPDVVVLPLARFMADVLAKRPLTVHGFTQPAEAVPSLLQDDRLHPSPAGCAVLTLAILDQVQARWPGLGPTDVRWNPNEVRRLVLHPPEKGKASEPGLP